MCSHEQAEWRLTGTYGPATFSQPVAGAFGYEAEHYAASVAMGEERLAPAVRNAPDATIVAAGTSCRAQIAHTTGRTALHPAQALAARLA